MPTATNAGHTEGLGHESGSKAMLLCNLLGPRTKSGCHVSCLEAKFWCKSQFDLTGTVLCIHSPDINANLLHVVLELVAKVHGFGVLQGREDFRPVEVRLPTLGLLLSGLGKDKLQLSAGEDFKPMLTLEVLDQFSANASWQRHLDLLAVHSFHHNAF